MQKYECVCLEKPCSTSIMSWEAIPQGLAMTTLHNPSTDLSSTLSREITHRHQAHFSYNGLSTFSLRKSRSEIYHTFFMAVHSLLVLLLSKGHDSQAGLSSTHWEMGTKDHESLQAPLPLAVIEWWDRSTRRPTSLQAAQRNSLLLGSCHHFGHPPKRNRYNSREHIPPINVDKYLQGGCQSLGTSWFKGWWILGWVCPLQVKSEVFFSLVNCGSLYPVPSGQVCTCPESDGWTVTFVYEDIYTGGPWLRLNFNHQIWPYTKIRWWDPRTKGRHS